MDTERRKRGRPIEKEWLVSEDMQELIKDVLSNLKEAAALLESGDDFPCRVNFLKAEGLIKPVKKWLDIVGRNPSGFSPVNDFNSFVRNCVEFDKREIEAIGDVYEAYIDWSGIIETDIKVSGGFSRIQFVKAMLDIYGDKIYESVQRVRGSNPRRAFIGLRLRTEPEIGMANERATTQEVAMKNQDFDPRTRWSDYKAPKKSNDTRLKPRQRPREEKKKRLEAIGDTLNNIVLLRKRLSEEDRPDHEFAYFYRQIVSLEKKTYALVWSDDKEVEDGD
jgi:hypothetical protein